MDTGTRRFTLRVEHHTATILDRNGPLHWRAFPASELPSEHEIGQMNEQAFDAAMSAIYYGESA